MLKLKNQLKAFAEALRDEWKYMWMKLAQSIHWSGWETKRGFLCEEGDGDHDLTNLSIIDIKAAIAKQNIPVSELYSAQDLAANRTVIGLVRDAELKIQRKLEGEIVVLKEKNSDLQRFKDQREVAELVSSSKMLTDKSPKLVAYMKKRFSTGRLVDLSGDLTDAQRQERINNAVEQELKLVEDMGIDFKETKQDDRSTMPIKKTPFDDDTRPIDYTDPKNNPLIPVE